MPACATRTTRPPASLRITLDGTAARASRPGRGEPQGLGGCSQGKGCPAAEAGPRPLAPTELASGATAWCTQKFSVLVFSSTFVLFILVRPNVHPDPETAYDAPMSIESEYKPAQTITDDEAAAMFRAALNLFEKWGLNDSQAATLLATDLDTFMRWKAARSMGEATPDRKDRLSQLMGIYVALRYLFRDPERGYQWVHKPNTAPLFGGRSAIDVMLEGGIPAVRRYLDAQLV